MPGWGSGELGAIPSSPTKEAVFLKIPAMKIVIENCQEGLGSALRKIGYAFKRTDAGTEELSAVRVLARGGFPRFHIYARFEGNTLSLNLHLDQKRPSYAGARSHSGEHDGPAVEKEAQRIKSALLSFPFDRTAH